MGFAAFSSNHQSLYRLDPRTKILLTVLVGIVMMGGSIHGPSAIPRALLALAPFGLLLAERKYRQGLLYLFVLLLSVGVESYLVTRTQGALNLILVIVSSLFTRFVPGLMMGYYLVSTTRISELIAALEKMHMPRQIVIPFAVMMRFFPTVIEENNAVREAMRMRGLRLSGGNVSAYLEYMLIPMMMCTVKIGEELSAAALTRGLGRPGARTSLCDIKLRGLDALLITISLLAFALWIVL